MTTYARVQRSVRPERRAAAVRSSHRQRRRLAGRTVCTRPACRSRAPATRTAAAATDQTPATWTDTATTDHSKISSAFRVRFPLGPSASCTVTPTDWIDCIRRNARSARKPRTSAEAGDPTKFPQLPPFDRSGKKIR